MGHTSKGQKGPYAGINKRVDSRLHQLEEIYMNPRIDGSQRDPARKVQDATMQQAIDALDITKQLVHKQLLQDWAQMTINFKFPI